LKIGVVCGGPSRGHGISLNSARSLVDHLGNDKMIVMPFLSIPISGFIDPIAANSIRNTPADFDVKPDRQRQFRSRRR
jgi:D-alanine-D-alanine ligase-like ATP-grasp enzyme